MSRAFVREDDGDRSEALSELKHQKNKAEWLKIQEKKLEKLLDPTINKKINKKVLERWIKETSEDIKKTKKELRIK